MRVLLDADDASVARVHDRRVAAEQVGAAALQRPLVGRVGLDAREAHADEHPVAEPDGAVDDDVVALVDALREHVEDVVAADDNGLRLRARPTPRRGRAAPGSSRGHRRRRRGSRAAAARHSPDSCASLGGDAESRDDLGIGAARSARVVRRDDDGGAGLARELGEAGLPIARAFASSRRAVGSSASRSRGRAASARAIATRWRSPIESRPTRWPASSASPTAASAACAARRARSREARAERARSRPSRAPSRKRDEVAALLDEGDCGAPERRPRGGAQPGKRSCRAPRPRPGSGTSSPARRCRSVDFPEPDGPVTAVVTPAANVAVEAREDRAARRRRDRARASRRPSRRPTQEAASPSPAPRARAVAARRARRARPARSAHGARARPGAAAPPGRGASRRG